MKKQKKNEVKEVKSLRCSMCGKKKLLKFFYKDSYQKRGYKSACKLCIKMRKEELKRYTA